MIKNLDDREPTNFGKPHRDSTFMSKGLVTATDAK